MVMKEYLRILLAAVAVLFAVPASAQVVTTLPFYLQNNTGQVSDLGNGPLEIRVLSGSGQFFTASGSAIGTATTTALTLAATPPVPPIVGGFITCNVPTNCSIPANTTVTAYNGTTGVTLSATATITAAQVNFGAACPASVGGVSPVAQVQASVGGDLPFYTQARVCAAGQYGAGATLLTFPIGAH